MKSSKNIVKNYCLLNKIWKIMKLKVKIKIKKVYRKITMHIFCLLFLKTHIIIPLIFNLNLLNF